MGCDRLTFDGIPKLVIVGNLAPSQYTGAWSKSFLWYTGDTGTSVHISTTSNSPVVITQNQKTLEWYNKNYAENQLNQLDSTYRYIAFLGS